MNEWTNLLFNFLHWVPPCRHEEKKINMTRSDIFNRASPPVIICISFRPLAHPLRKGHEPGPVFYCTLPRLDHAPVQPRHPPPFFWAGPPIPYPIFDYIYFCTEMTQWPYPWPYDHMTIPYRLVITFFLTRIKFRSPPVTLLRSLLLLSTLYLTTKLTPSIFPAFFAYFYFFPIFETAHSPFLHTFAAYSLLPSIFPAFFCLFLLFPDF